MHDHDAEAQQLEQHFILHRGVRLASNAADPCFAARSRFSRLKYALSAQTDWTLNPPAMVRSSIGPNIGQSFAVGPSTMAVVTMFVFVPVMMCAFTHARPLRSAPHFSS